MIPVGSDAERHGSAHLSWLLAAAAGALAILELLAGNGWTFLLVTVAALLLAVYAPAVEGRGRLRLAATAACGAAGGALIAAGAGGDARIAALAVAGATTAVVGVHLVLLPRARVLTLQLVPPFTGIVALPAWLWAGGWLAALGALGAAGAFRG